MPRIRTIKPEIWDSPDVYPMDDSYQVLWVWLISQADDAGRLHMDAALIAARRNRSVRLIENRLQLMEQHGMIQRYQVDGRPYIGLVNWHHQRVDHPAGTVNPGPDGSRDLPEKLPRFSRGADNPRENLGRTTRGSRGTPRAGARTRPDPTRPDPQVSDPSTPPAPRGGRIQESSTARNGAKAEGGPLREPLASIAARLRAQGGEQP